MPDDREEQKRDIRKGMPHHQDEFPDFSTANHEGTDAAGEGETASESPVPAAEKPPARETKVIREQKEQSVLRNRFIREEECDETEGSMVERVVDNLLHEGDEAAVEECSEGKAESPIAEDVDKRESKGGISVDEKAEEEPALSSSERAKLAKRYEAVHNKLFVIDIVLTITAILAFLFLGGSTNLREFIHQFTTNVWLAPIIYGAIITLVYYFVLLMPLHAIDFHFENKFQLNTQSFGSWLEDNFKSLILNMLLVMLFLEVTYFLLRRSPVHWWIWASGFWVLFGVLMANLLPVLILPLFYKLTSLKDDSLREKLKGLVERVHIKVLDVYEIKLSEKTKKANAMLAGLGNTKRIILGDTLLKNYSNEEIETIIAHELGHHYHKHIPKIIAFGSVVTFAGFFIAHQFLVASIGRLGYLDIMGIDDIAGFPLLLITLFVFGLFTMPINNYLSRTLEKQADRFALRLTDRPSEFISVMKKIADQNLADKEPSAIIEFLLHDHPSISSRIAAAEDYSIRKRA